MKTLTRAAFIAAATALLVAGPAMAQEVALSGSAANFFKIRSKVAIPAYHITFITQQQATAAASISARTRLNTVLAGVDDSTMKRLTNEAYADLVAQATAAGLTVVPAADARALVAGAELVPGNHDADDVGASITVGRSVKRGYAAFGADDAPMLTAFHAPTSLTGVTPMQTMGVTGKLGRAAKDADAVAVIPTLIIDFINMEANASRFGRATANTSGEVQFSLRAYSGAAAISAGNAGPGFMQGWRMTRDTAWDTPFSTVAEGAAGVRTGSMTAQSDNNYQLKDRARGDAVNVDLPVWEGLVRDATKRFNAALVAEMVKAKG